MSPFTPLWKEPLPGAMTSWYCSGGLQWEQYPGGGCYTNVSCVIDWTASYFEAFKVVNHLSFLLSLLFWTQEVACCLGLFQSCTTQVFHMVFGRTVTLEWKEWWTRVGYPLTLLPPPGVWNPCAFNRGSHAFSGVEAYGLSGWSHCAVGRRKPFAPGWRLCKTLIFVVSQESPLQYTGEALK